MEYLQESIQKAVRLVIHDSPNNTGYNHRYGDRYEEYCSVKMPPLQGLGQEYCIQKTERHLDRGEHSDKDESVEEGLMKETVGEKSAVVGNAHETLNPPCGAILAEAGEDREENGRDFENKKTAEGRQQKRIAPYDPTLCEG